MGKSRRPGESWSYCPPPPQLWACQSHLFRFDPGARLGNGRLSRPNLDAGTWACARAGLVRDGACAEEKLEKMDFTKFPKLDKKKMDNLEACVHDLLNSAVALGFVGCRP